MNQSKQKRQWNLVSLCCILYLLLTSCWDRQRHEASGPELPNYSVSGTVFHSVTSEPLPDATVTIDGQSILTDSLGRYSISSITGGEGHAISISKVGFNPYSSTILMGYADLDSYDAILGKLLYFSGLYQGPGPEPNGIIWTTDLVWSSCGSRKRIYAHDAAQGLEDVKYVDSPGSFPSKDIYTTPYGMTVTEEAGAQYLWISVAFADETSRLYKMRAEADTTLLTVAQYETPESVYGQDVHVILNDLTCDGTSVWSCSARERRVFKHGDDMSVIEHYDFPDERPVGIAWDGKKFWMSTNSSERLYMLDAGNLNPLGYYILQEAPVVGLLFREGRLWACKHGSQSWPSYFYTYEVE